MVDSADLAAPFRAFRLLDLGAVEPYRAQTLVEAIAPSVARGTSPPTVLLAAPERPYASLGFHQSYDEEIDEGFVRRSQVPVIRRVTGGGTTWLDRSQAFYEFVYPTDGELPSGTEAFPRLLDGPLRALRALGVAARLRPPSDLVVGERKISGNAGGEWEGANILQGGLLGERDAGSMARLLRSPHPAFRDRLTKEIEGQLTSVSDELGRAVSGLELHQALRSALTEPAGPGLIPGALSEEEEGRFREEVLPRHRTPAWARLPAVASPTTGLLRRVRVAGSRFLEVGNEGGEEDGWTLRLVDDGRVLEAFALPPPERYRGPQDLRRLTP